MTTDKQLFAAIRTLPHMAITKKDGEYRVTYRLASIVASDQGRHDADWHRDHTERAAYYTADRDDAWHRQIAVRADGAPDGPPRGQGGRAMSADTTDELGERIVASGFAPNLVVLDINHSLSVPHDFALPAPWNLPSRMFRFPIEVCRPDGGLPRKLGLRHPLLADHPYVRHVEVALGMEIDRNGAPNRYRYTTAPTAR